MAAVSAPMLKVLEELYRSEKGEIRVHVRTAHTLSRQKLVEVVTGETRQAWASSYALRPIKLTSAGTAFCEARFKSQA